MHVYTLCAVSKFGEMITDLDSDVEKDKVLRMKMWGKNQNPVHDNKNELKLK